MGPCGQTERIGSQCGRVVSAKRFEARIARTEGSSRNAVSPAAARPARPTRRSTAPASARSPASHRPAIQKAAKSTPTAMLSGWPASAPTTNTNPRATTERVRPTGSRPRSMRKSIHGQRQNTAVCGKKRNCEKVSDSPKATAAKNADRGAAESSRAHSHIPAMARMSLSGPRKRNAAGRPSGSVISVKSENAADWLLAASGVPQPFHRSRSGRAPSRQAVRTASVHGRISVTTSSR